MDDPQTLPHAAIKSAWRSTRGNKMRDDRFEFPVVDLGGVLWVLKHPPSNLHSLLNGMQ